MATNIYHEERYSKCQLSENQAVNQQASGYPSYPGQTKFSYISLQNLGNGLHKKQKVDNNPNTCLRLD